MITWTLDRDEILRYLGYRGQTLEPALLSQLGRCQEAVCRAAEPKLVWRELPLEEVPPALLRGADIAAHLAGCGRVLLLAATLGAGVDSLLLRTQVRDVADAMIMDACASAAIESVCDRWEAERREELARRGLGLTSRFSPGYGDLPLSVQPLFLDTVDAVRRIGLHMTPGDLMVPRKSVTALLGVGAAAEKRRSCETCALRETCQFTRGGRHCGR